MNYEPNAARRAQMKPSQCTVIRGDEKIVLPYTSRKVHDAFMTMRAAKIARELGLQERDARAA